MPSTRAPPLGATDLRNWRLDSSDDGRQVWFYDKGLPPTASYEALWGPDDRRVREGEQSIETCYALGLPLPVVDGLTDPGDNPLSAARKGFTFYKRLQAPDGHWSGECGGPHFLLGGMIIALYVTHTPIPMEWKIEISRYLANVQRDEGTGDEGWGIDIQGRSTVFGTTLNYIALRLLGVDAEVPMMVRARATLRYLGGAAGIPTWGKFWLSVLNLHEWAGFNPTPPELWLLPEWLSVHPHRWWCQTRNVFTPMSFLYRKRFQTPLNPLLESLRDEIYIESYAQMDWPSIRNNVAPSDLYSPHTALASLSFNFLTLVEPFMPTFLSEMAMKKAYRLVVMEDENTSYQTIAPVSKALNMICRWVEEGPGSEAHKLHVSRVRDFFWMGAKGMTICGTNGSQAWDASFMSQALYETGLGAEPDNLESSTRVLEWLDRAQMRENPPWLAEAFRQPTKGGWTFSTKEQSYPVSDCTSEALKAVILLQKLPKMPQLVSQERMEEAIDLILTYQNSNGGFSSFEPIRGPAALELLNASEVFGAVMIEYSYPECTTACLTALDLFQSQSPKYRKQEIGVATSRGLEFIRRSQRADGGWYGSWGVCFTYATMFGIESLALNGETYRTSSHVHNAVDFLLDKQKDDGGWGESFKSCETHSYVQHQRSQIIQTSWAILALLHARYPDADPIRRGCRLIMSRQLSDGSWPQESIEGVFNHAVGFSYPNFKFSWTIWALGKAAKVLGSEGWAGLAV